MACYDQPYATFLHILYQICQQSVIADLLYLAEDVVDQRLSESAGEQAAGDAAVDLLSHILGYRAFL